MPAQAPPTSSDLQSLLEKRKIRALIFDMDGVVTQTAKVHARAWKKLFDEFLTERGLQDYKTYPPFDLETDYPKYIDGIPRLDGVRNFLISREIQLPEGTPEDKPGIGTINALGNLKNTYFRQIIQQEGVATFQNTIAFIRQQKDAGLRIAIISASKNCSEVLEAAGIINLFDALVDGQVSEQIHLKGKPAPDIFLEAASRLKVPPAETAIFEDARAGVKAGKAGGFKLIIGIDRTEGKETTMLLQNGADLVIAHF